MIAARFSEVFSKKGLIKQRALKLLKEQLGNLEFYGSIALVDEIALHFPGVSELGKAFVTEPKLEKIKEETLKCAKSAGISEFWLDVKRTSNHRFTSLEVAREVGTFLESNGMKAKKTGKLIRIEIHDKAIVYAPQKGIGGLPAGLFGKAVFIWEPNYKSQIALLKLASRGYEPIVVVFGEGEPAMGKKIKVKGEAEYAAGYSLHGMKGPLVKLFTYKVAERIRKLKKAEFIATGEVIGNSISEDPTLLRHIESLAKMKVKRPIGFQDIASIREEAKRFGFSVEDKHKEWKRFKEQELEQEWNSLEMDALLNKVISSVQF